MPHIHSQSCSVMQPVIFSQSQPFIFSHVANQLVMQLQLAIMHKSVIYVTVTSTCIASIIKMYSYISLFLCFIGYSYIQLSYLLFRNVLWNFDSLCMHLLKSFANLNGHILPLLYKSLMRPRLEYANVVWGPVYFGNQSKHPRVCAKESYKICSGYLYLDKLTDFNI